MAVVSTHSRPKATGRRRKRQTDGDGFNTQPPEGDCWSWAKKSLLLFCFNTQPPEGDCDNT